MTNTSDAQPNFPRAALRSWMEVNVRPWLAVTLLMLVAATALGVVSYSKAAQEQRLITSGTPRDATVVGLGADTRQMPRDEEVRVTLEYADPKSGRTMASERLLHRKRGSVVALKQVLKIRVDPNDPAVWTERTEPPPLMQSLTVPLMLVPVVLLSFLATWWQRSRVNKVLKTGTPTTATVASIRQSPLAPLSKQIGLALTGGDRTIRQAYWPARNGPVAKGDTVDVIADGSIVLPLRSYGGQA